MKSFGVCFTLSSFILKKLNQYFLGGVINLLFLQYIFYLYNTSGTYQRSSQPLNKISKPQFTLTLHEDGVLYRKFSAAFGNQLKMILKRKKRKEEIVQSP